VGALGSPLAVWIIIAHSHMAQHLLLMTVAAPLILLGAPAITLLHGLPQHFVALIFWAIWRCPLVHGIGRIVTHPVFCWLASTAAVIGWHVPALFELGMQSEGWHAIEHAVLSCGRPSILVARHPALAESRAVARMGHSLVPFPCDVTMRRAFGISYVLWPCCLSALPVHASPLRYFPLGDQECAGALMWVWVTFAYLAPAAVVTIEMLSPQRRSSKVEVA
jgi:putative membrane protein